MPADLHIHTVFSDGAFTPEEVVEKSHQAGLTTIAITDHDTVDAIPYAVEASKKCNLDVISGVEFSTELPGLEIHILGYSVDINSEMLKEILADLKESRQTRIYKIVQKLEELGIKIDVGRVLEIAGSGSAGRPHVAHALIESEYVSSIPEAFKKYLNYGAPGYVGHYKLTPREAIDLILKTGGKPVLAHPGVSKCDHMIPEFISQGLAGIEVFYINHNEAQIRQYLYLTQKNGLIATGGSDFHGNIEMRNVNLGDIKVKDKYVEVLKKTGSKNE